MNKQVCNIPKAIEGFTDTRWDTNTIYNHYESPLHFMDDVLQYEGKYPGTDCENYIQEGKAAWEKISKLNLTYDKLYEDVAKKVKDKLIGRGFTSSMLYSTTGFTSQKTGVMSKQRVMLGKKDCYFKDSNMDDGKLFHDIYVNLSYSYGVADSTITKNSYALYALTKELSSVLPIRVFVINHVGTDTPSCYSYVLKKFGNAISPEQFLFFTSSSKRTFGWASYNILKEGRFNSATVGSPSGTVSIADFKLNREIDSIFEKLKSAKPELFKRTA